MLHLPNIYPAQHQPIQEQSHQSHRPKVEEEVTVSDARERPISMFCGFPVMVATLPTFDHVATARRYGSGAESARDASTKGTITRHTISFTKNAESTPDVNITAGNSRDGFNRRSTISTFHSKNPTRCSVPTISIIENSSTSVGKSMKWSGFGRLHNVERHHADRADDGCARTVNLQSGKFSQRKNQIARAKDYVGGQSSNIRNCCRREMSHADRSRFAQGQFIVANR